MPLLVTFRGRPVKRRYRANNRLNLVLLSPQRGQTCERLTISDAEWRQFGKIAYFESDQMPDRRQLAAEA